MPAQTTKSRFVGGLKKHADKPVDWGQEYIDLPGGIQDGRARLVELRIGEYKSGPNQGKPFFLAAGIVVEPKEALSLKKMFQNGRVEVVETKTVRVEGQRTQIMIPLCQTTTKDGKVTTQSDYEEQVANELKKLLGEACLDGIESDDDLLNLFTDVKDPKKTDPIYFKFATRWKDPTKDYPEGGVWPHNWYGMRGLEAYSPPATNEDADDSGPAPAAATKPSANGKHATTLTQADSNADGAEDAPSDEPDVDAIVAIAGDNDDPGQGDAQEKLIELAVANGWEDAEARATNTWEDTGEMAKSPKPAEEPEPPAEPKVKDISWKYQQVDAAGKPLVGGNKKPKPPIQIEVMSVNTKNKTATIKDIDSKKLVVGKDGKPLNVKFSDLIAE